MLRHLALFLLTFTALIGAQPKLEISAVNPTLQFGANCSIQFNQIGTTLAPSDLPRFSDIAVESRWIILLVFQNGQTLSSRPVRVTGVRSPQDNGKDQYPITGQVLLTLAENVDTLPLRIFVSLDLLGGTVKEWQPSSDVKKFASSCAAPSPAAFASEITSPPQTSPTWKHLGSCDYSTLGFFKPAKGEDNVNVSGTLLAGYSARPLYSIDATIELPLCPTENYDFNIGGAVKSAERRSLDLDSFSAYLSFKPKSATRYGNSTTWYRSWDIRGGEEFSRKDQFENIVFAPKFVTGYADFKVNSQGRFRFSGGFELTGSVEVGHNRRTKSVRAGYGGIGRIAPAVVVYFRKPLGSPGRSLVLTSTYNPRILLSPEPFADNRIWVAAETPFKSFASGTRHYWLNQIDIDLTDLAALVVKSEFGSLPPAFNIIDFRFTTGLTLKWKWRDD